MELELYNKHKELIDKIILIRLSGKIILIDNKIYVKIGEQIFENNSNICRRYFHDFNQILPIIDSDDYYFKILSNSFTCMILNPMDVYYYYNIKKLKEDNNKMKELLKTHID
jgi:hypothetical protein